MQLGQTIQKIRKENHLTQEEFAEIFHVTRQTVSNWENEKSYPDLLTLVAISDNFHISLDKMLKEDIKWIDAKKSNKYRTNDCSGTHSCKSCSESGTHASKECNDYRK